ncbi:hypothetical protein [Paraclostridium sordellii]|uniref:hypothetical protein n=1 Tax=Paraclostridium sordellii TaxID=1505 RepID=UPI00131507BA|nr:hypothetical protein [Paeniclostridium sordellii]
MSNIDKSKNMFGFKTRGIENLYINEDILKTQELQFKLVGEDTDKYYLIPGSINILISTPKDRYSPTVIQKIDNVDGVINDYRICLKEIEGNKYKVYCQIGENTTEDIKFNKYEFDMEFSMDNKCMGIFAVNSNSIFNTVTIDVLYSAYIEDEIGMKIDTTLDKEPIYFCDGTKDRLIITEDMIVRGNTNFNNDEITINDKRIITEDNLKG